MTLDTRPGASAVGEPVRPSRDVRAMTPRPGIRRGKVLAVDPGTTRSAWALYDIATGTVQAVATEPNDRLLHAARKGYVPGFAVPDFVVIEQIESFGMAVGREVFETVYFSGQLAESWHNSRAVVTRVTRRAVKLHLCGTARAKDPNIRQALLDRFGGSAAKGTKAKPGPLYGVSGDVWSALAVAITWAEVGP